MTNHGPDTSDNVFELLELDLPTEKAAPKAAPAVTATAIELSPLDQGKALVDSAKTLGALKALAGKLNGNGPEGYWFRTLEEPTREAVRLHWRNRRDALVVGMMTAWPTIWGSLATGIEARPHFYNGLPHSIPAHAPAATSGGRVVPATERQAIPVVPATEGATLAQALGNIAAEGAANAAGQVSGSLADGSMRGVGFSSSAGYVTALANGVKAATAEQYKNILRVSYHFTAEQIAALTVTIIPEGDLPLDPNPTVVRHEGPSMWDVPRSQRAEFRKLPSQREAEAKAKAEQEERDREEERVLIAGLVESREGLCVSPGDAVRGYRIPAPAFRARLGKFASWAPRLRTNEAQFGEVMRGLRTNGLIAFAAVKKHTTTDWPANVKSRYIIGRLDTSTDLDTMGQKALVADLVRVTTDDDGNKLAKPYYEIKFTGGEPYVREAVTLEFEKRTGEQLFTATYLGQWFTNEVLRKRFHALRWGGFWFVPGTEEQTAELQELVELLTSDETPMCGRDIGVGATTTKKGWSRGVKRALLRDLAAVEKAFAQNTADGQERARKLAEEQGVDAAGQAIAARQGKASAEAARTRLKELNKHAVLIDGYRALLGDEYAAVHATVCSLRAAIEDCLDSTSLMAANIELDLDEAE